VRGDGRQALFPNFRFLLTGKRGSLICYPTLTPEILVAFFNSRIDLFRKRMDLAADEGGAHRKRDKNGDDLGDEGERRLCTLGGGPG
jgi:hypothetical protein